MRKTYTVHYERDESGAWLAEIREVKGCHTYGRTLAQARERIREALKVSVDDPAGVEHAVLVDAPRLPAALRHALVAAKAARARAEAENTKAQSSMRTAVRLLTSAGLSVRDAAELLGVSHQRVHQLAH